MRKKNERKINFEKKRKQKLEDDVKEWTHLIDVET